jgi:hypothetical protein
MHGSSVNHPKDPINGLKGGSLSGSPLGESLGYPPFDGW